MTTNFEKKTTEAAAFFLKKSEGRMKYLKLIKLLYFADREAISQIGLPITFDNYCSMENGPVLSKTYDWIKGNVGVNYGTFWASFIEKVNRYWVSLTSDPQTPDLSTDELEILQKVWEEYGKYSEFQLVEITHQLPEYKKPQAYSSLPITNQELISVLEKNETARNSLLEEIELYKFINS